MGTSTTYRGVFDIVPPLTWPEVQQSTSWRGHREYRNTGWSSDRYGATLILDEQVVDTPEGTLIRRTGESVEITGEELRHDEVMADLRSVARLFGGNHGFVGALEGRHDHPDDPLPFLVRISGTDVIEERPVLLWPGNKKAEAIIATTLRRTLEVGEEATMAAQQVMQDLADGLRRKGRS